MTNIQEKKWLIIVLFNLFIVALAGLILRAFHYVSVPILNYSNFMEGHSHFAFGGWGFMALFIGLYHAFLDKDKIKKKVYSYIFWVVFIMTWGMLFTFPIRGYASISTAFATLYIWTTYWFAFRLYKDTKNHENTLSLKFLKAALLFLVLSSLGPYIMGGLMASGYQDDPRAMNAIYFYLHFQYNGWFIFGIFALFFKWMENRRIVFSQKRGILFYRTLFWSCFPAFLLSVLWGNPDTIFFIIAGLAGVFQLLALIPFYHILYSGFQAIKCTIKPEVRKIGVGLLVLLVLKYFLQFLEAIPAISIWTTTNRNLIIAYLHLVLLGVFTIFLLLYFLEEDLYFWNTNVKIGVWLFIIGFILTEAFLFLQSGLTLFGTFIPSFGIWMFYTTLLLPVGSFFLFVNQIRITKRKKRRN